LFPTAPWWDRYPLAERSSELGWGESKGHATNHGQGGVTLGHDVWWAPTSLTLTPDSDPSLDPSPDPDPSPDCNPDPSSSLDLSPDP
jgi:hypothetical protein